MKNANEEPEESSKPETTLTLNLRVYFLFSVFQFAIDTEGHQFSSGSFHVSNFYDHSPFQVSSINSLLPSRPLHTQPHWLWPNIIVQLWDPSIIQWKRSWGGVEKPGTGPGLDTSYLYELEKHLILYTLHFHLQNDKAKVFCKVIPPYTILHFPLREMTYSQCSFIYLKS